MQHNLLIALSSSESVAKTGAGHGFERAAMLRFVIALLLFISSLAFVNGQRSPNEEPAPAFQKNWEIGYNLLNLIEKNDSPATTVFIRRNISPSKAWRFKAGLSSTFRRDDDMFLEGYDSFKEHQYYMSAGREWRHFFRKSGIYWGLELFSRTVLNYSKTWAPPSGTINPLYATWIRNHFENGLTGFFGFQYSLTSTLSFSIESKLKSSVLVQRHTTGSGRFNETPSILNENATNIFFENKLKPIAEIKIIYTFKFKNHEK